MKVQAFYHEECLPDNGKFHGEGLQAGICYGCGFEGRVRKAEIGSHPVRHIPDAEEVRKAKALIEAVADPVTNWTGPEEVREEFKDKPKEQLEEEEAQSVTAEEPVKWQCKDCEKIFDETDDYDWRAKEELCELCHRKKEEVKEVEEEVPERAPVEEDTTEADAKKAAAMARIQALQRELEAAIEEAKE